MAFIDPVDIKIDLTTMEIVTPPVYVFGLDAVVQGCVIRLSVIGGELFQDTSFGLDYLPRDGRETSAFGLGGRTIGIDEAILGSKFDPNSHRSAIRDLLLSCPGVESVVRLALDFQSQDRELNISFSVDTIYGLSDLITAGVSFP